LIFVTVGTQLPFTRLIAAMDRLAPALDEEVVAQVGPDKALRKNIRTYQMLTPEKFTHYMSQARVVVAHAGIGTLLECQTLGKPLIVLPRRFELREHRNDHQMATVHQIMGITGLHVAWDIGDLETLLRKPDLEALHEDGGEHRAPLLRAVADFIAR
jgi:UDP-N-acetylglucosamine transferase subunit ALG13